MTVTICLCRHNIPSLTSWPSLWRHKTPETDSDVMTQFCSLGWRLWCNQAVLCCLATKPMVEHEFQYKLCKGQQISPFKPCGRFCSFSAGWLIWDSWLYILNFSTLRPRCEAWECFPIHARPTWLPWKPMGPLTLRIGPPPTLQVWCPSAHKHQRSRPTKFNYDFLYWWNVAWKPVIHVSMTTPWIFLDASLWRHKTPETDSDVMTQFCSFPITLGPRPTLSRKPRRNRTKIEEKLKIPTSEFYYKDTGVKISYQYVQ